MKEASVAPNFLASDNTQTAAGKRRRCHMELTALNPRLKTQGHVTALRNLIGRGWTSLKSGQDAVQARLAPPFITGDKEAVKCCNSGTNSPCMCGILFFI